MIQAPAKGGTAAPFPARAIPRFAGDTAGQQRECKDMQGFKNSEQQTAVPGPRSSEGGRGQATAATPAHPQRHKGTYMVSPELVEGSNQAPTPPTRRQADSGNPASVPSPPGRGLG